MAQDERDGGAGDPPPWRDSLRRARRVVGRAEEDGAPPEGWRARLVGARHIVAWGAVAAVLVLFAAGLLYLYSRETRAPEPVAVSADHAARRVKPEAERNPAGIPDAEVYDTLRSPSQSETRGQAADTSPTARKETGAENAGKTQTASSSPSSATPPAADRAEPLSPPSAPKTTAPKAPPRPADAPASLPAEERAEQERALSGSYAVQIAAFHMRWRAEAFVNKAAFDHRDVLEGLSAAIVPAEKDGQTFWRVRYGPFFDRASATAKCREIRAHKLNCIVVRVP